LLAGGSARWPGEFCRRLLPESFGPEFGGGFPEALDERFSEERELQPHKVERAKAKGLHGDELVICVRALVAVARALDVGV
jgi:hypothetical protein